MRQEWNNVRIELVEAGQKDVVKVGDDVSLKAWVNLGGLKADEVAVQIFHGPLDATGDITQAGIITMVPREEKRGNASLFSAEIRYHSSGRHGFTVRVLPHHPDLVSPFETRLIHWASDPVKVTA